MAKTSIVDEIEHHPQFCLDLSDPLGAIRMGNSIGWFGDRHPAPALGFNARDRYFHFRRTFDKGLHAFVENAFESRVRYRYSCHGRTRKFGVVEPNVPHRHHDAIEFPDGSDVLVTLLVEGQRATVLQLPVVHQISGRTTKAEEHGSTPAAAASAAGRSCEVPAMPAGVSATKPDASAVTFFRPGTAGSP